MTTSHTTIHNVTFWPANGEKIEIPKEQIQDVAAEGGVLQVVQLTPEGRIVRWLQNGSLARIEHDAPSGLVVPAGPRLV